MAIIGTRGYPSYYGGFETAVRKLAPSLADAGWDVTVFGRPGATREGDPERDTRVRTVVTRGFETRSLSTLSYGLTATLRLLRNPSDVVLVMNVANGFWLPLLRARGIPTLVNVDGIEWDRAKWGLLAKLMFRVGAKLTARFGSRLVFDAKEIGRRWQSEFRRDGEFIPYGGVARSHLPIVPGLEHRGYVLVVARFVPENTIGEFLEAASALATRWPIVIVGTSGYGSVFDAQAESLAHDHENVQWLGHVSDDEKLDSLWQHSGAYFHGHSVGGTNPALVQAMACGAPTIARDTVYNREVLGRAGVFVPPVAAEISKAIDGLMQSPDLQESLIAEAHARQDAEYTWDRVNTLYERALAELVAAPVGHESQRTADYASQEHANR